VFDPTIDDQGKLRGFSFETVAAGKKYVGLATPHARIEGHKMAWRVKNSEVRGLTTVELTTAADGTRIVVTLEVQSAGLLSTMFFPVIAGAIGNGLPKAVDQFAQELGS
jgi:carbon monoxide dehydrogenase subunit G